MAPIRTRLQGKGRRLLIACIFAVALGAIVVIPVTALFIEARSVDRWMFVTAQRVEGKLMSSPHVVAALSSPEAMRWHEDGLAPYTLPVRVVDVSNPERAVELLSSYGCEVKLEGGSTVCFAVGLDDTRTLGRLYIAVRTSNAGQLRQHMLQSVRDPPDFATNLVEGAHRFEIGLSLGNERHAWMVPVQTRFKRGKPVWNSPQVTAYREGELRRGWSGVFVAQRECTETDGKSCVAVTSFSAVIPRTLWDPGFSQESPALASVPAHLVRLRLKMLEPKRNEQSGTGRALLDTSAAPGRPKVNGGDIQQHLDPGLRLSLARKAGPEASEQVLIVDRAADEEQGRGLLHEIGDWALWLVLGLVNDAGSSGAGLQLSRNLDLGLRDSNLKVEVSAERPSAIHPRLATEALGLVITLGLFMLTGLLALASAVWYLQRRIAADAARDSEREIHDRERRLFEVRREQERAAFEARLWRHIGHEIRSPISGLESLLAGNKDAAPYIKRMTRALRVFTANHEGGVPLAAAVQLELVTGDIVDFLRQIAANAEGIGVPGVSFETSLHRVLVRAEFEALADVFANLLDNANRFRVPSTNITITLSLEQWEAVVVVHNQGDHIPESRLGDIFDSGVSGHSEASGHLGLGLFMAALYMNKMGGSILARNASDGVDFELRLRRADS